MSKQCEVCGKKPIKAAKLTFSHKQIVKRQTPNLQDIRVNVNGQNDSLYFLLESRKSSESCLISSKKLPKKEPEL